MWVEFQASRKWQFVTCLSGYLSRQLGIHVWQIQQDTQQYIVKFLSSQATAQVQYAHQRELCFYKNYQSHCIFLDFDILAQANDTLDIVQQQIWMDKISDILVLPYGITLHQQLEKTPCILLSHKIAWFRKICNLVSKLHQLKYIHGDLKLQHFVWQQGGEDIKLIDFAQIQKIDQAEGVQKNGGTPAYMAPELFLGHAKTIQTDLYALGIVFYQLLMNSKPFKADRYQDWAIQHCQQEIPLLPDDLKLYQSVLDRMLAKKVEHRFLDVQQIEVAFNLIKYS